MLSDFHKLHSESNGTNIQCLILEFRSDFLGKVSPNFQNCGVILETFTMRPLQNVSHIRSLTT